MKAEIEVLQPGLFSTIQDSGRFGFMKYGVPMSGCMDKYAATLANLILNNPPDAALLEITITGPKLQFTAASEIVITGGELSPRINDLPVINNKSFSVVQGDILSFGIRTSGARAYLGISGGFLTEVIMGSRSWFYGITENFRLEKRMKLQVNSITHLHSPTLALVKAEMAYLNKTEIEVFTGPEFNKLPAETQEKLIIQSFTVGKNSNRMALQPEEVIENSLDPIITGPVLPGTVQLTPSGNLIFLMRDCQTTGGYPRILQLSEDAINILSQKIPGDKISLRLRRV